MLGVSRIGVSGQPSHVAFVVVLRASTHSLTLSLVLVAPILRVRLWVSPPKLKGAGTPEVEFRTDGVNRGKMKGKGVGEGGRRGGGIGERGAGWGGG